ncbi:Tn3 family transposase [Streptomyces sp. NPDC054962]
MPAPHGSTRTGDGWSHGAELRRRVAAAANKVESINRFSQRVGFGSQGVLADNDPIEQEKAMKFNVLLRNAEHIKRLGEYSTHEPGIQPEAYDPKHDVDFTQLRAFGRS